MHTNLKNKTTWQEAKLHMLETGQVFAVVTTFDGWGVDSLTFNSVSEARDFFTAEKGWAPA